LLLLKGSRPVSSFTVPGCLIGLVLLLLVASVTLALLLYYGYFGLQDQIGALQTRAQKLEKKVASLQSIPKPVLGLTPPPAPPPAKLKPKPKPAPKLIKVVKKPPAKKPAVSAPPPARPVPPVRPVKKRILAERDDWSLIQIDNVKFSPSNRGLRVRFDIKSAKPGSAQLEGYYFILGVDTSSDPPMVVPYTNVRMKGNLPENYKRGMSFSFKYQKPTNSVTIRYPQGVSQFKRIYVLIYDKNGELKVIKAIEVKT
jgi:hypothetical protein